MVLKTKFLDERFFEEHSDFMRLRVHAIWNCANFLGAQEV